MTLYRLLIHLYVALAHLAACFSPKVRTMLKGQKQTAEKLRRCIEPAGQYVWVHAASLGEFEQGRPIIEQLKALHPEVKILLTFFSPSGYEVRKNYEQADVVCYLPFDTTRRVKRFLKAVPLKAALFIKYEFWPNYLNQLRKKGIPTYSVAAVIREKHIRMNSLTGILDNQSLIMVQDHTSAELLRRHGLKHFIFTGDPRFDRVLKVASGGKTHPVLESFCHSTSPTVVVGSSWPEDEALLFAYAGQKMPGVKWVVAPHVISERRVEQIKNNFPGKVVCLSEADEQMAAQADCLVVNCYGLLSSLYKYADVAYVGGGFGKGIHNSLEPAVHGCPVLFGTKYTKFTEAVGLVAAKGAFSISDAKELDEVLTPLLEDEAARKKAGDAASAYVQTHAGATDRVINALEQSGCL